MSYRNFIVRFAVGLLLAVVTVGAAQAYRGDPPSRVGRVSFVRGEVSFAPAGEPDWVRAYINRPLIRGDRLWTDRRGRAEVQVGSAAFRLDQYTSFELLNLDDRIVQAEVTQGSVNLRVRRLHRDQEYEIATPTLALVVTTRGRYRVDVDDQGTYTDVVVWEGEAIAYGDNARFPIRAGEAVRFYDARLRDYEIYDVPRDDEFDAFCYDRDRRFDRSVSLRYVSEDVIGWSDLDEYGSWAPVREYGDVWFPRHVDAGWAPYRDGHWAWIEPWGWTWVDDQPWGFAPSHYGRWVYTTGRWGWIPSPRVDRVVYAPALVGFIGGGGFGLSVSVGEPIGWFPLGYREVYVPPYYASRDYFTRINVTNTVIQNNYITNVYNNYYNNDGRTVGIDYMNRRVGNAVTVVPRDVFTSGRPVDRSMLRVDPRQSARAEIMRMAAVTPTQRSLVGAAPVATARPNRESMDRRVIARNQPGEVVAPFAARQRELSRNPGRPLRDDVEQQIQRERGQGRGRDMGGENVRVVGAGQQTQRTAERVEDRPMPRGDAQRGRGRDEMPPVRDRVETPATGDPRGRDVTRESREMERQQREIERPQRGRDVSQDPRQVDREAERAQREADRQQRQQFEDARGRDAERQQREMERQQRDGERQQRVEQDRQRDVERQQRQVEQQQREVERQQRGEQERQRDVERQQRQAEQVEMQRQREAQRGQQQAEQQQREVERQQRAQEQQQRQVEQQQREAQQFERQRQREAEMQQRQQEQQQREQERQRRDVEMQQRQQEQQQRQMEQQQREQQRQQEMQQRQMEQQQRQQQEYQQQEQQRQQQQYERQQQQEQRQQQQEQKEEEREDRGRGRGRGRDDGGWQ